MKRGAFAHPADGRLVIGLAVILLAALAEDSVFQLDQTESALVLRLGAPVRALNRPGEAQAGLHVKWPLIEQVVRFDRRIQSLEVQPVAVTTADHQTLVVNAYVNYRITDPFKAFKGLAGEPDRLADALAFPLRQMLDASSSEALLQGAVPAERLKAAAADQGVQVVDVGLSQVNPAPADALAMIHRMRAAEIAHAAAIRSAGEQRKQEIMAHADGEASLIKAQALAQSEAIWGDADAQRAAIFADAYGRDPSFAHFYQALRSYEAALSDKNATLVISSDSAFFDVWRKGASRK